MVDLCIVRVGEKNYRNVWDTRANWQPVDLAHFS